MQPEQFSNQVWNEANRRYEPTRQATPGNPSPIYGQPSQKRSRTTTWVALAITGAVLALCALCGIGVIASAAKGTADAATSTRSSAPNSFGIETSAVSPSPDVTKPLSERDPHGFAGCQILNQFLLDFSAGKPTDAEKAGFKAGMELTQSTTPALNEIPDKMARERWTGLGDMFAYIKAQCGGAGYVWQ